MRRADFANQPEAQTQPTAARLGAPDAPLEDALAILASDAFTTIADHDSRPTLGLLDRDPDIAPIAELRSVRTQVLHDLGDGRLLGEIMAVETRALNDDVLRHLGVVPGERILEIGFGHGRTLERAAKAAPGARFAGIDHAEDMVAALSRRARRLVAEGRLDVRAGDSSALPWPDATFDGPFAVHTIYFWPDPARHLAEIHRVLRPGGRLVLAFRDRTPDVEAKVPPDIYHLRSRDEVLALLASAGFDATTSAGSGQSLWIADARKR